jgi:hypothetical protein
LAERLIAESAVVAAGDHPVDQFVLELRNPAGELESRHGAPKLSASPGVKPANSMAARIACSWSGGTPSVLPSTFSSSGFG